MADWWANLGEAPLASWPGPQGVNEAGGGSVRGCGRVGDMSLHRAVCNRNAALVEKLVSEGVDVNQVEAAGNTPLHSAAFEGWVDGVQLLLRLGAKVNASNNAGDRPYHWASNMGHEEVCSLLEKHGATKERGKVLVQEHVPKVKDFFSKPCWSHHPKPYTDFIDFKKSEAAAYEAERKRAIRV
ncbi:Serine/threonine-protein kinase TNNI3K [Tetrabaena socialis]|uniref:Serine/threonine-protein kinase TNNI3K n=1 Tax=Tetrabaena socialis TaxID=47790 RepID=A0A2J8AFY6_9CHLO|nr:Serine/threonine-protein kinase TNNI3K [Tetrabaena socialis]|eukprot:PNH11433.1 Serine/threonine-protein kinase TNNI3K [Tetrabaena socialis]